MGRHIVYDRRFISIGEKFIPLFQCGSSNATEYNYLTGKEIAEKYWTVFNYGAKNKILFSREEIIELSKNFSNSYFYKSYNTAFVDGEFERWFINGTRNAQPVEYYLEYGNSMFVQEYGPKDYSERHYIKSTEDLIKLIDINEAKNLFGNSYSLVLQFSNRTLNLPKKRRSTGERKEYPEHFILTSKDGYFVRKVKWGFKYAYYRSDYRVKRFKSEKQAETYLDKFPSLKEKFLIEKIEEVAML